MSKVMRYRTVDFEKQKVDGKWTDIFDGEHYQNLRKLNIKIEGFDSLQRLYFDQETDIALGICTDGFCVFDMRNLSAWPILLINYNLPPEIHYKLENFIPVGIIPGPKGVKDINSFLEPLVEELIELAQGVRATDVVNERTLALRAHLIVAFGDMPAMAKLMRMLGHNGKCAYRFAILLEFVTRPSPMQHHMTSPYNAMAFPTAQASILGNFLCELNWNFVIRLARSKKLSRRQPGKSLPPYMGSTLLPACAYSDPCSSQLRFLSNLCTLFGRISFYFDPLGTFLSVSSPAS